MSCAQTRGGAEADRSATIAGELLRKRPSHHRYQLSPPRIHYLLSWFAIITHVFCRLPLRLQVGVFRCTHHQAALQTLRLSTVLLSAGIQHRCCHWRSCRFVRRRNGPSWCCNGQWLLILWYNKCRGTCLPMYGIIVPSVAALPNHLFALSSVTLSHSCAVVLVDLALFPGDHCCGVYCLHVVDVSTGWVADLFRRKYYLI